MQSTTPLSVLAVRPKVRTPPPFDPGTPRTEIPRVVISPSILKIPSVSTPSRISSIQNEGYLIPIIPLPYSDVNINGTDVIEIVLPEVSETSLPPVVKEVAPSFPPKSPPKSILHEMTKTQLPTETPISYPTTTIGISPISPRIARPSLPRPQTISRPVIPMI